MLELILVLVALFVGGVAGWTLSERTGSKSSDFHKGRTSAFKETQRLLNEAIERYPRVRDGG